MWRTWGIVAMLKERVCDLPFQWSEGKKKITDIYFCMIFLKGINRKNKHHIQYPDVSSASKPIPHSPELPVPEPDSDMRYMAYSIGFHTSFVRAFKIVVDAWTFSMLLIYILWDDWPILMISGSNEQLQQQLEYTLLKHDCHSRWISKMQFGLEDTLEERYAIKICFKLGKHTTETYGMLQTAFGSSCMNRASVFQWHKRFKEGRDSVRDVERCGRSKEVNTPELIGQRVRVRVTMLRF